MAEVPRSVMRSASTGDAGPTDAPLLTTADWSALQAYFELSPRQLQTAELVCRAYDNKRIAGELHVCSDTVRMHLKEVFRKVGVETRTALLVRMMQTRETLRQKKEPHAS